MTASPMALMSDEEVAGYGRDPEAGFGALQTAHGMLPLVAMEVDARVAGVVATIDVAQTFRNTSGAAIEATYIFPLPDRAAVHRFRMEVGSRVIDGVIDERGAARERYDEAIAAGHRAAIAEQERAGVFTLRVGNLMPGDTAVVRLSLIGVLPVDDGEVVFRFPLVVAPRYIPGAALGGDQAGLGSAHDTDLVPDASRISPPVRLAGFPDPVRLGLRVAIEDGAMRDVASSLHAVTVSRRDAQVVEVQPGERLDRDFLLRWRIDGAALGSSLICAQDPSGAAGTFALTIVPPSTQAMGGKPRDVVFVLDRSGSMRGWKMVAARRCVARMVDTLTARDRFLALAFDNALQTMPAGCLVEATDRRRFRAVEELARVDARGGTDLAEALNYAVAALGGGTGDRERVIVLVTDGQVGNEDQLLRELAPALHDIKMFTLGIDQAVNAGFLRRLAAAGGGMCELVESEDRLDAVMAKVHRRIGAPIATELALRATGLDIDRATLAPAKLPDVYAGAPVVVFGRYRGTAGPDAAIDIEGTSLGDPLRMTVRMAREPASSTWLAASWARAHLHDLEDRYAAGAHQHEPAFAQHFEQAIVRVSKQFSVLSRFTAFLAVDRGSVVNAGGGLREIVQPVERPAGWDAFADAEAEARRLLSASPAPLAAISGVRAPPPAAAPAMAKTIISHVQSVRAQPSAPPPVPLAFGGPPPTSPSSEPLPMGSPLPRSTSLGSGQARELRREISEERRSRVQAFSASSQSRSSSPPSSDAASLAAASTMSPAALSAVYGRQLPGFAMALENLANGAIDPGQVRLLRQRLDQWVEDLCNAGGHGPLTIAVQALVERLTRALAEPTTLRTEIAAIAEELARLAAGAPPPPVKKKSRLAFWK